MAAPQGLRTPEDAECLADLAWALVEIPAQARSYQLPRDYLDGKQRLLFASEKFRNAFGNLFKAFAMNLCPSVVEAITDRLDVEAWEGTGAEQAQQMWDLNRMPLLSVQVHEEAISTGDQYVIVWPNEAEEIGEGEATVRIFPQDPRQCTVVYDDEDPTEVVLGAKLWCVPMGPDPEATNGTGQRPCVWRCNLYYEDVVVKFQSMECKTDAEMPKLKDWGPFVDEDGDEGGPTVENPTGIVPMFHFAPSARVGGNGVSALRDVIPIQDALNKTISDMLVGGEFAALGQRWAIGVEPDEEEPSGTGQPVRPRFRPGGLADNIWTVEDENAKFGEFTAADLTKFTAVADFFKVSVAQVTGTPVHYMMLSGDFPSGESLKTADARLVKKCERHQTNFGFTWADVMRCALAFDHVSAGDLAPVWDSAATRDEMVEAQTQVFKQQVGVSTQQSLKELGYTEEEVSTMIAQKEENQRKMAIQQVRGFNSGRGGTPMPGIPGGAAGEKQGGTPPPGAEPIPPSGSATG